MSHDGMVKLLLLGSNSEDEFCVHRILAPGSPATMPGSFGTGPVSFLKVLNFLSATLVHQLIALTIATKLKTVALFQTGPVLR